eukprot:scaffold671624_cov46-Prasinocladus_malaysianus.AAC.1
MEARQRSDYRALSQRVAGYVSRYGTVIYSLCCTIQVEGSHRSLISIGKKTASRSSSISVVPSHAKTRSLRVYGVEIETSRI